MEILPSLLSFIDSKIRTFKKRISDTVENPNDVAEHLDWQAANTPTSLPRKIPVEPEENRYLSVMDPARPSDTESVSELLVRKTIEMWEGARDPNKVVSFLSREAINPLNYLSAPAKAAAVAAGSAGILTALMKSGTIAPSKSVSTGNQVGAFISRGAKSWNQPRYIEAVKMKVKGANRDEIWNKTGTWLDTPDMLPRQEVSDLDMKIRGWEHRGGGFFRKIGSFHSAVEHPLLTSAHPELLRDLQVAFTKSPDQSVWGKYTPEQNLIQVSGKTDQDILYVLSHELQHVIQHANKFASGGSPKAITLEMQPLFMRARDEMLQRGDPEKYATEQAAKIAYRALAGEAEARAVMDRLLEGLNTGKHPEVGPWKHYDVDPKNTIVHFYNRK